jgi:hypothetical protein
MTVRKIILATSLILTLTASSALAIAPAERERAVSGYEGRTVCYDKGDAVLCVQPLKANSEAEILPMTAEIELDSVEYKTISAEDEANVTTTDGKVKADETEENQNNLSQEAPDEVVANEVEENSEGTELLNEEGEDAVGEVNEEAEETEETEETAEEDADKSKVTRFLALAGGALVLISGVLFLALKKLK